MNVGGHSQSFWPIGCCNSKYAPTLNMPTNLRDFLSFYSISHFRYGIFKVATSGKYFTFVIIILGCAVLIIWLSVYVAENGNQC